MNIDRKRRASVLPALWLLLGGGANAFAQGAGTSAEQVFAAVSPKVWTVKAAQPQGS